jgi:hypothetical protein
MALYKLIAGLPLSEDITILRKKIKEAFDVCLRLQRKKFRLSL